MLLGMDDLSLASALPHARGAREGQQRPLIQHLKVLPTDRPELSCVF